MQHATQAPAAPSIESARLWWAEATRETVEDHTGDPTDRKTYVLTQREIDRAFELMTGGRQPTADDSTLRGRVSALRSKLGEVYHSTTLARCDATFEGLDETQRHIDRAATSLAEALTHLDRASGLLNRAAMMECYEANKAKAAERAAGGS